MNEKITRRVLFLLSGLLLLIAPILVRTYFAPSEAPLDLAYTAPDVPAFDGAATPEPTWTAETLAQPVALADDLLRRGPIVVDLAHFNRVDRAKFQPLADDLARRGIGLRFWLPTGIDPLQIQNFLDFPDQSNQLAAQLNDASGIIIAGPFFLWSPQEIELLTRFVADGGRLLLISDPSIVGDVARDINHVAEPFGVVFNDDYIYDTQRNDGNHTYVFQQANQDGVFQGALDQGLGQDLDKDADKADDESTDSAIAFYGARSISGALSPQLTSVDSALSSTRSGLHEFVTVALAGLESNTTYERVLAMSDLDVLSEPFVDRHNNRALVHFVADFLAGGAREETLVDFPNYLGKEVALVYGSASAANAATLLQSARLQQRLVDSGRELALAQTAPLTDTGPISATIWGLPTNAATTSATSTSATGTPATATPVPLPTGVDLIYLGDFKTAAEKTNFLVQAGFTLVEVERTPTPAPTDTPTATASPTGTATSTATPSQTPTAMPTMVATATPMPTEPLPESENSEEETQSAEETSAETSELFATQTVTSTLSPTAVITATKSTNTPAPTVPTFTSTPTFTPMPTATVTPTATETATPTSSATATATETPTPTATPTPERTFYLENKAGLRLLADETVLILQTTTKENRRLVVVLSADTASINAGVTRLLEHDFSACVQEDGLAICPYQRVRATPTREATKTPESKDKTPTPADEATDEAPGESTPTPTASATAGDGGDSREILVIDDNDNAAEGEDSEADFYLRALGSQGYEPDLWSISDKGLPKASDLNGYRWVIWSSGGYESGGPTVEDLDPIFGFINEGGQLTISSRTPFFGEGRGDPEPIADVVAQADSGQLGAGLPTDVMTLESESPPVRPLEIDPEENNNVAVVLRRGPNSTPADAILLFALVDDETAQATGARLIVLGMAITWLPNEVGEQLVQNMAEWVLAE